MSATATRQTAPDAAALPPVTSPEEWRAARQDLLAREKELTRALDALAAARRRLPMVAVNKPYVFETETGLRSLPDLFAGRRQLIVYHFMFDPDDPPAGKSGAPWSEGCPGCSYVADNLPHLAHLQARDVSFTMVSRAPLKKILPFKQRMGWTTPWASSCGSDFNYDFHVTIDPARGSTEWNFRSVAEQVAAGKLPAGGGELPGLSVFLRDDAGGIYHTYSTFARGLEQILATNALLDLVPYGRQEPWEDSPAGWPKGDMWWLRHHDRYDGQPQATPDCCRD